MAVDHTIQGAHVRTRHPFAPLGLSLITFGVYGLYWYYTINREMRDLGEDVKPGRALLAVTLGALVIVPAVLSMYHTAERILRLQTRAGVQTPISPVLAVVMLVIPIVNYFQMYYLQSALNGAYEAMVATRSVVPESIPAVTETPPAEPAV
jgi:hypothetical protein